MIIQIQRQKVTLLLNEELLNTKTINFLNEHKQMEIQVYLFVTAMFVSNSKHYPN